MPGRNSCIRPVDYAGRKMTLVNEISVAVHKAIEARELHKFWLLELRKIAVDKCGFDQEMVVKSSVIDLLDGFVKGVIHSEGGK